ncbi:MAG: hypothetical protein QOG64_1565, partial [Acidimicrobiaceae bacterium]|nr:hypothetical protein [Acidimicrobiaceae bacterium]
ELAVASHQGPREVHVPESRARPPAGGGRSAGPLGLGVRSRGQVPAPERVASAVRAGTGRTSTVAYRAWSALVGAGPAEDPAEDPAGGRPSKPSTLVHGVGGRVAGQVLPRFQQVIAGFRSNAESVKRAPLVALVAASLMAAGILPALANGGTPAPFDPSPAARNTEPVVLTGTSFPTWAAPADVTAKAPGVSGAQCIGGDETQCSHNRYEKPEVDTANTAGNGVDVAKLTGYRWNSQNHKFVQIPFQVDQLAIRYLSNNASGFSIYSETDQHPTYVFDEERFRWTASDPANPCQAAPEGGVRSTPDPVPGLDTDDEVSFMASDAGPAAPDGTPLPSHVAGSYRVTLSDPYAPGQQSYVYVMLADDSGKGPKPAFNAANGYVRYQPDADSNTFLFSESRYSSYGNAAKGPYFDPATNACITDPAQWQQHRPKDTAWIRTPTSAFRYDGRWLMTQTKVRPTTVTNKLSADPSTWTYGPDLTDQWKARAFQQRPGGQTPCCGYEEEVNNWGGSSILMGWRAGPVRVIRATWGSDSATNNIRTETFYRDEMRQDSNLRVHVIPPGDGIYAQWDFNAGKVSTYFNPFVPNGVAIDGKNDEVFGNARVYAGPEGLRYQSNDQTGVAPLDQQVNDGVSVGAPPDSCSQKACINNDVDVVDPTLSGPAGTLNYEETTGAYGTFVDRYTVKQVTAGTAYTLVTTPYYRDDSCFDDGTGTDPGPHVRPAAPDPDVDGNGQPRRCWAPGDPVPGTVTPADHYYQGDIGTHGVHILLIADSDNAHTTEPVDEIDASQRRVILPGRRGNVGEQYGRSTEKPLIATATPL